MTMGNITSWHVDRVTEEISSLLSNEGELGELLQDLNARLSTVFTHIKIINEAFQRA
jgi:hypothetical protein